MPKTRGWEAVLYNSQSVRLEMKPPPFKYLAPDSLEQALELMAQYGEEAKLLAGGQSLIPAMNFRVVQPAVLVDLNRIKALEYVENSEDGSLAIGAMTRQRALEFNPIVAESTPLLHECMPHVAHPQIRNRGTLGGSLAGKHALFKPRVEEALRLHAVADLHAMIDISDGLAADLYHVLEESGVGAEVRSDAIPISEAALSMKGDRSPLERALGDGEDFELLFTVNAEEGKKLLDHPPIELRLSHIGEITAERTCVLIEGSGRRVPLERKGWEHRF